MTKYSLNSKLAVWLKHIIDRKKNFEKQHFVGSTSIKLLSA